jgi:hypothetical protein
MQAEHIPDSAIAALAELLLDFAQHEPCGTGCIRCPNEANHTADDGQQYCELCRGCYVDAQADE